MNSRLLRALLGLLAAWLALSACTVSPAPPPATDTSALSQDDVAPGTAALAPSAQPPAAPTSTPQSTASAEPTATECQPTVTANLNANIRSGPGTAHGVVGSLVEGDSATVLGRNDDSTWWYIDHGGGQAWIAASVTTSACIPGDLAIVAGPTIAETGEPHGE